MAFCNKAWYQANKERIVALQKAWYQANKEKKAASQKVWREANKERVSASNKAWYQANKEKVAAFQKAWKKANKEKQAAFEKTWKKANKEKQAAFQKVWREANKEKVSSYSAKRKALKLKQMPIHLRDCPIEKERVEQTYKLRNIFTKAKGVEYHVDHMWPLSDGGPHWSGNLQIITAKENLSKGSKVNEDIKNTIQEMLEEDKNLHKQKDRSYDSV